VATPNYDINYNDARFKSVENDKQTALNNINNTYNNMINQSDKFYQDQIQASKDYANKQSEIQQANTDFAIDKINQQKEYARKDYLKEQTGAYTDWQKQSNMYGANAEQMAASGLANTGYSESSQVSMYNTYQNRISTARDSFNRAVLEYDNAIKEAQLANNSALADIAYKALQTQLEVSLQGFQYKNTLLQTQINEQQETEDRYHQRWQDVLSQINTENSLKEQVRQYEEKMAYQRERDRIADEQWNKQYQLSLASMYSSGGGRSSGGSSGGRSSSGSSGSSDTITTAYYSGKINPDAKYGTFSNGYQPNNVGGQKLTGTGKYINKQGVTLQGTKTTTKQQIWQTSSGAQYYWDGNKNKYVRYK
jgi:hypothetical protein